MVEVLRIQSCRIVTPVPFSFVVGSPAADLTGRAAKLVIRIVITLISNCIIIT